MKATFLHLGLQLRRRLAFVAALVGCAFQAYSATYYVSPTGNDANAGTSKTSPWQTIGKVNGVSLASGDRVLFEGGKTFAGPLNFGTDDNGTSGSPIVVGSYGTGRATINGGTGNGINLVGCTYLTVKNLNCVGNGRKTGSVRGIGVFPSGAQHVVVDSVETSGFQRAGLEMRGCTDIRVTHVYAHDNGYAGISSGPESAATSRDVYIGYCRTINNPGDPSITNNHSGNGIVLYKVAKGTIEYCESAGNGWDMQQSNCNGPVGIWCANGADQLLIQYNISHDNASPCADGGGFDFDGGTSNSVMQYNYAYGNKNYGFLFCEYGSAVPWTGNTARYNIAINNYGQGEVFLYAGGGKDIRNAEVYNNVLYNDANPAVFGSGINNASNVNLRNNILVGPRGSQLLGGSAENNNYFGNLYWALDGSAFSFNGRNGLAAWASEAGKETLNGQVVGVYANPNLTNPANYPRLTDPTQLGTLLNYFGLQAGSPAIDKGLDLQAAFSLNPGTRDFFGNAIPQNGKFDIGAHELFTGPQAPQFTSTAPTTATVGAAYSYAVRTSGNPAPTVSASGLPNWLTFNATTATLSGTPATANVGTTGTITLTATNSQGTKTQAFTVTVSQPVATSLVANPGFENNFTSWRQQGASVVSSGAYAGSKAAKISGAGNGVWQPLTGLKANTTYTVSAYGKLSVTGQTAFIYVKSYGGAEVDGNFTTTSYAQASATFTTGASATTAEIGVWKSAGSGDVTVDDFTLTEGTATCNVAVASVTASPATLALAVGSTGTLAAAVAPITACNQAVAWASSNTAVAAVSSAGLVAGVAAGTATITATTQDGGKTASSTVTVTAAAATNLLSNPGFESDFASWQQQGGSIVSTGVRSGGKAAKVSGAGAGVWRTLSGLKANTTYTLSAYGRLSATGQTAYVYVKNYGGAEVNGNFTTTVYTQASATFTTGASATTAEVGLWKSAGTGDAWVDDFAVVGGPAAGRAALAPAAAARVALAPNPARRELTISSDVAWTSIRVLDFNGREVAHTNSPGTVVHLRLPTLPAGLYLVSLQTEQGVLRQKLAIE